jgi:hypothetical protein
MRALVFYWFRVPKIQISFRDTLVDQVWYSSDLALERRFPENSDLAFERRFTENGSSFINRKRILLASNHPPSSLFYKTANIDKFDLLQLLHVIRNFHSSVKESSARIVRNESRL